MLENPLQPRAPLIIQRGVEDYQASFDAMRAFTDARSADTPDELWIVEHAPVFTLGAANLPAIALNVELERQMLPSAAKVALALAELLAY